jgi:hypothetical protein
LQSIENHKLCCVNKAVKEIKNITGQGQGQDSNDKDKDEIQLSKI